MTTAITVRRTTEDDWEGVRDLRLEMLSDTPLAYLESLGDARRHGEAHWRARAARGSSEESITVVAVDADRRFVGTMGAYVPTPAAGPTLVAVYVNPAHRGRSAGVTDLLLGAIEAWARQRGGTLTLEVHEQNARARAAYEHRGFVATGAFTPYALNPVFRDLEMIKQV